MTQKGKPKIYLSTQAGNLPESTEIDLPLSKSESNRILILNKVFGIHSDPRKFSDSSDSKTLFEALDSKEPILDLGDGGTTYRFLTAFFATKGEKKILYCSERMEERPIRPLVDALTKMGAEIQYLKKEGFPPVQIKNEKAIHGAHSIDIDLGQSSQFASSLALVAPLFGGSLELKYSSKKVSLPYLEMTLDLLADFGMEVQRNENGVKISGSVGSNKTLLPTSDWSSAIFPILHFSLSPLESLTLNGLKENSIQGDSILFAWLKYFGLKGHFTGCALVLYKSDEKELPEKLDLKNQPDLALPFICWCLIKNKKCTLTGLEHLQFKESNRLKCLQSEVEKLGFSFSIDQGSAILEGQKGNFLSDEIETYNDHRIAMSMSLFCWVQHLAIKNPQVVEKSFPNYWKELSKIGIAVS